MHAQRASLSAVGLVVCLAWAVGAWLMPAAWPSALLWQRIVSVLLAAGLFVHVFLAVTFPRTE
jgi:hypothetical protein